MGFLEILTIIFIVLKLVGVIDWSWWLVWAPMYPALFIYVLIFLNIILGGVAITGRRRRR